MDLEVVNQKLGTLLQRAAGTREELSGCPKQLNDISQSVESIIATVHDAETQLWQQARLPEREQEDLLRVVSDLSSSLQRLEAILKHHHQPHPVFSSLYVWKSAASVDLWSSDLLEVHKQVVASGAILDTLVDKLRQEASKTAGGPSHFETWMAIQTATKEFGLCPNRLWAVARGQQDVARSLTTLIRPLRDNEPMVRHADHDQCNYELCEHSRRDFTWVAQRHESEQCRNNPSETCEPLRGRFPTEKLDEAVKLRMPTAWKFDGLSTTELGQGYMAVSHVWSDGTGTGAWLDREVNACLYNYFVAFARLFQCEGIWWDTVCIPKDKTARSIAVNSMHRNYQDARVTFVHDCYLREWPWYDGESACIAIILSPWFSRGWTALELANSIKVKVVFKDAIKDLDEHILAKSDTCTPRHKLASRIISNLRRGTINTLNDLLAVLQSRNTSWPRDIAVIAGLLTGVETSGSSQQHIYQKILRKIGAISPDHLFHNSPLMSDPAFSWCPANPLDMEISSSEPRLNIAANGDVYGKWRVIRDISSLPQSRYVWRGTHTLIEMQLRSTLEHSDDCMLLVDLPAEDLELTVARALLVKTLGTSPLKHRVLGCVYFHPPLRNHEIPGMVEEPMDIIIGNQVETAAAVEVRSPANATLAIDTVISELGTTDGWTALHQAIWQCSIPDFERLIDSIDLELKGRFDQSPLHLASERGNPKIVEQLLSRGADPTVRCNRKQTPLHRAAWGGSLEVTEMLLKSGADPNHVDTTGHTPLHLAIRLGYVEVASSLIKHSDVSIPNSKGSTALHLAVPQDQREIVKSLVGLNHDIDAPDGLGWTLLHHAAYWGRTGLVEWLLHKGADLALREHDGLRPVHMAAKRGNDAALRFLLRVEFDRGRLLTEDLLTDELGDLLYSASMGGVEWLVSDMLRVKKLQGHSWNLQGRRALHIAAEAGHTRVVNLLLDADAMADAVDSNGWTPLFYAAESGRLSVAKQLIQRGANITAADGRGNTPFEYAAINNHAPVVKLLLEKGAALGIKERKKMAWEEGYPGISDTAKVKVDLLCEVVKRGHGEILTILFENGVKEKTFKLEKIPDPGVNIKNHLLEEAARHGHVLILKLLLEQGARVNIISHTRLGDRIWEPVLYWASEAGHLPAVRFLLSNGAEVDPRQPSHVPLAGAALNGYEDIVRLLLKAGADINRGCECHRRTALSAAASKGRLELIKLLLQKGAVAEPSLEESPSHAVEVPIVIAAGAGHEEIVRLLLNEKANIDRVMVESAPYGAEFKYLVIHGLKKRTALAAAAAGGHFAIVKLLLERGASLDPEMGLDTRRGPKWVAKPLAEAARFGHKTVVDLLIRERPDIKRPDLVEEALSEAAEGGHTEVVELLLQECSSAVYNGEIGLSRAMDNATRRGHSESVKVLVKHGAEMPMGQ